MRSLFNIAAVWAALCGAALAQDACNQRCQSQYQSAVYPQEQRECMRGDNPAACINRIISRAKDSCKASCASSATGSGAKPIELDAPAGGTGNPARKPGTPSAVSGDRG